MPKYEVDIPHSLDVAEAKQRLNGATAKLQRDYGANCAWKTDNELTVSRKGLDARVTVEPARVHIDLNLGFLLTPFAEKIKSGIARELTGILTKPASN
ncbi:MAG TPA: polyhydroxyalkanoic acid system family protein [Polyangia bacterium]|nr:polyhydroxyalkanoic acid system family protein [Polyangia bacterium]